MDLMKNRDKFLDKESEKTMILYATKETVKKYDIPMPEEFEDKKIREMLIAVRENEEGKEIFEWGVKVFYFDRRKCLQLVNFSSKFTIFLIDVKKKELSDSINLLAFYLEEIYADNPKILKYIKKYFEETPIVVFSKLKNQSIIATLNNTQRSFALDGERFYNYIENGVLKSVELNKEVNSDWIFREKIDNKQNYFYSKDKFAEKLVEYYKH